MPSPISAHRKGFNAGSERRLSQRVQKPPASVSEFAFEFEIRNERYLVDDLSAITPVTAARAG